MSLTIRMARGFSRDMATTTGILGQWDDNAKLREEGSPSYSLGDISDFCQPNIENDKRKPLFYERVG